MVRGRSRGRSGRPGLVAGWRSRERVALLPGAAARTQHGGFLGRLVRVVRVVGDRGGVPGFQLLGLQSPPRTVNGVLDGSGPAPV